jgi:hypothetical protein
MSTYCDPEHVQGSGGIVQRGEAGRTVFVAEGPETAASGTKVIKLFVAVIYKCL